MRNGNSTFRMGHQHKNKQGAFRVSIGPTKKHYAKLPRWRQRIQKRNYHFERRKGGYRNNKTGKDRWFWGDWK